MTHGATASQRGNDEFQGLSNSGFIEPAVRPHVTNIPIIWGYNPAMFGSDTILATLNIGEAIHRNHNFQIFSPVVQNALNRHFNVQLEGIHVTNIYHTGRWSADLLAGIDRNPHADIYLANPLASNLSGLTRTIPDEMIRRYAPNYALLLDINDGWVISRSADGEQMALNTFDAYHNDLDLFSVYRLDWLQDSLFPMPGSGNLTQLAEGVYFSSESYTFHEFTVIMDIFTHNRPNPGSAPPYHFNEQFEAMGRDRAWGMEVNLNADLFQAVAPILGMYGVNTGIMEENGAAVPFFASLAYRDALLFLEELAANESIFNYGGSGQHELFTCGFFRIGWAAVRTRDLFDVIGEARQNNPNGMFLITPPEHGPLGNRGVGLSQGSSPFNANGTAWVIDADVDDDMLSRILNIFDALSFDPEFIALTAYGFNNMSPFYRTADSNDYDRVLFNNIPVTENERVGMSRFIWNGDPFDSTITIRRPLNIMMREGVFFTGIVDGINWEQRFLGGFDAVNRFAQSDAGMRLNLLPSREDVRNVFAVQRTSLDEQYRHILLGEQGLVTQYIVDVLIGDICVVSTWDGYIASLNAHGLQEYIALFSQFPKTAG